MKGLQKGIPKSWRQSYLGGSRGWVETEEVLFYFNIESLGQNTNEFISRL